MERKHSEKLVEPTSSDGGISEPQTLTKEQYAKLWAEVAKNYLELSTDPAKKGETSRNLLKTEGVAKGGGPSGNNLGGL